MKVKGQDDSSMKNGSEVAMEPSEDIICKLFDSFLHAQTCNETMSSFLTICQVVDLEYPPPLHTQSTFYPHFKKKFVKSWRAQSLWQKVDKHWAEKEFFTKNKANAKRAGEHMKVLIIGAGPCGLRTAIDMACLGVKTVVVEKRDAFSRNNILHLWPFIITDLKGLGAKKFYGRFCAGAIDHISIRQLQLVLLKVCLILGVEVIFNVSFEDLVAPSVIQEKDLVKKKGWTALVEPCNHRISKYEFNVIVGADGKRNTLKGFKRKEFRGKLAIGLTVNFINHRTSAEAKVEEISGVAYIFNQEFFKNLHKSTGIDLENIVYYKGDTHYFVMTAKKHSLISKGVLKQDYDDIVNLLSLENVNREAMMKYAKEAADFSTEHQLPNLDFAINQYGQADIALFDFTCMYAAENATHFREVAGKKLMCCLVGDSLLEPFWPMGTGCARGFLAGFDTVWMTKQWALKLSKSSKAEMQSNIHELAILAERESVYRLLHQTTPQNTAKRINNYTINPASRYVNLNLAKVKINQVKTLYLKDQNDKMVDNFNEASDENEEISEKVLANHALTRKVSIIRSSKLLSWCHRITEHYNGVNIVDMTSSWKSGLALCALIHQYRPDLINWHDLNPSNVEENNKLAFDVAEKHLGILPVMTGRDMALNTTVDKLIMVTYISEFYEVFKHETPSGYSPSQPKTLEMEENVKPPKSPSDLNPTSPVGLLTRFTQHFKRRSTKSKHEDSAKKKKYEKSHKVVEEVLESKGALTSEKETDKSIQNRISAVEKPNTMQVSPDEAETPSKPEENEVIMRKKPGVRQSNKISELSSQLISQWEQNAPLPSTPKLSKQQPESQDVTKPSTSNICYFCNKRVYIVERLSAEGFFFHRQCFTCFHCGITLRHGNYEFTSTTGRFFCRAHYLAHSDFNEITDATPTNDEENRDVVDGCYRHLSKPSIELSKRTTKSTRTPERIELENIRYSMLNNLEELPEEVVTEHNLTGLKDNVESAFDAEDMSDSSDDDDIDWEKFVEDPDNYRKSDLDIGNDVNQLPNFSVMERISTLIKCKTLNELNSPEIYMESLRSDECKNSSKAFGNHLLMQSQQNYDIHSESSSNSGISNDDGSMCTVDFDSDLDMLIQSSANIKSDVFYNNVAKQNEKPPSPLHSDNNLTVNASDTGTRFNGVFQEIKNTTHARTNFNPAESIFLSINDFEKEKVKMCEAQIKPINCLINYIPKHELLNLSQEICLWPHCCLNTLRHVTAQEENSVKTRLNKWLLSGGACDNKENFGWKTVDQDASSISSSTSQDVSEAEDVKETAETVVSNEEAKKESVETGTECRNESDSSASSTSLPVAENSNFLSQKTYLPDVDETSTKESTNKSLENNETTPLELPKIDEKPVKKPRTLYNICSSIDSDSKLSSAPRKSVPDESVETVDANIANNQEKVLNPFATLEKFQQYLLDTPIENLKSDTSYSDEESISSISVDDENLDTYSSMSGSEVDEVSLDLLNHTVENPEVSSPFTDYTAVQQESVDIFKNAKPAIEKVIYDESAAAHHLVVDNVFVKDECEERNNTSLWTTMEVDPADPKMFFEKPLSTAHTALISKEPCADAEMFPGDQHNSILQTSSLERKSSERRVSFKISAPPLNIEVPQTPPGRESLSSDSDQFYTPIGRALRSSIHEEHTDQYSSSSVDVVFEKYDDDEDDDDKLPIANQIQSSSADTSPCFQRALPALPKVPHLEALSPTGSTPDSKLTVDEDFKTREKRVRKKIEKMKKRSLLNRNVKKDKKRRALPMPNSKSSCENQSSPNSSLNYSTKRLEKNEGNMKRDEVQFRQTDALTSGSESIANRFHHPKSKSNFRASPDKKEAKKSNAASILDDRASPQYTNQSDFERAILRGERLRLKPDLPTEYHDSDDSLDDDDVLPSSKTQKRGTLMSGLTPAEIDAKITRRVQIAAKRQAKLEAQKRLRRAQAIQRQLEEVEVKQKDLEEKGVELEKLLRGEGGEKNPEDSKHMQGWFELVQEKNGLLRYENELMIYQRELQLEDIQSRLQQELRERMAMDDKKKTAAELAREKEILRKMLDVVEQRDELVALLEDQRLKDDSGAVDLETLILQKLNTFSIDDEKTQ